MTPVGRTDERVLLPGDFRYDRARTVWNAMIDHRPRKIMRCKTVQDVATAVRTARDEDLEIGVRCGGHSVVGQAVPDGGLMIDLTPMGGVRVDPGRRRAWVEGGALLGALDLASQQHGLATTAGNVSHTGVGGLALGGGMGWLARQYGLTCDNVESMQLVTAEGEVIRASRDENPELFWGLRGGGGNFGVVTDFELRLHPVVTGALVAELVFPADAASRAFQRWRDLAVEAPREATCTAFVGGDGTVTLGFVWVGDPDAGRALLRALRSDSAPTAERVFELSYLELQRIDDTVDGHAFRRYWKGHYLRELSDAAIEAFLHGGTEGAGEYLPNVSLQTYGGAIADVPDQETAFSHRDTMFEFVAAARWSHPAEDELRIPAARRRAAAIDQFATGVYVNTLSDEGTEGVRRAYPPDKLARLTALKDIYDPGNAFHLNHNIRPSAVLTD